MEKDLFLEIDVKKVLEIVKKKIYQIYININMKDYLIMQPLDEEEANEEQLEFLEF